MTIPMEEICDADVVKVGGLSVDQPQVQPHGVQEDSRMCIPLEEICVADVDKVGGLSAGLGDWISPLSTAGVPVPGGFSTTSFAYQDFLDKGGINAFINDKLGDDSIYADENKLKQMGRAICDKIMDTPFQADLEAELKLQWERVSGGSETFAFVVSPSATVEDLLDPSFPLTAGEELLDPLLPQLLKQASADRGGTHFKLMGYDDLKQKVHFIFAPLFTDRAIAYRRDRGYRHSNVQLCATCLELGCSAA